MEYRDVQWVPLAASNNPVGAIMIISLSFGFAELLGIAEELV